MIPPALVQQAQRGDQQAISALLAAVRPAVLRYCQRRANPDSAEDIAQEVCLCVLAALPRYEHRGRPFLAFAYTVAGHCLVSAYRAADRDKAQPVAEVPEQTTPTYLSPWTHSPEEQVLRAELSATLAQVVRTLTPDQQRIVLLRVVVGLSSQDTAVLVNSNSNAVRQTQHRALRQLRKTLTTTGGLR